MPSHLHQSTRPSPSKTMWRPSPPSGIVYNMLRDKTTQGRINVQIQRQGSSQTSTELAYSMIQHGVVPNAAREEVTLYDSDVSPEITQGDSTTSAIGGVNFHHWLRDRSRGIVIRTRSGETDLKHPFGSNPAKHVFRLPSSGDEVKWVRASFEDTNSTLREARRRKCVDANNNTIALLVTNRSVCSKKMRMTMTQVTDNLGRDDVEALLLSTAAMWIKAKKRALAGSQAGVVGGMGSAATLAVLG